jgi:DNA-binding transcriptional LysR family regulator
MLDGVSLDQLRTFIAAADEGSFSAASRKLLRAQSVVSDTISNLEEQIRVTLFDRSGRYPKLTPAGVVLLADARSIVTGVDLFKARAKGVSAGLEPELSLVIDVFYPIETITQVAKEFRQQYPDRSELSSGREFGVMSPMTWRLADLFAKHHFLLNGLGWGGMPLHAVRKDLEEGRLGVLSIEDVPPDGLTLSMSVAWQTKSPPGPAGRWFIERLKQIPLAAGKVPQTPVARPKRRRAAKA